MPATLRFSSLRMLLRKVALTCPSSKSLLSHPPVGRESTVGRDDLRRDVAGAPHAQEGHNSADFVCVRPSPHRGPLNDLLKSTKTTDAHRHEKEDGR